MAGDTSFEEFKLQAYWGMWSGQSVQQIEQRETQAVEVCPRGCVCVCVNVRVCVCVCVYMNVYVCVCVCVCV